MGPLLYLGEITCSSLRPAVTPAFHTPTHPLFQLLFNSWRFSSFSPPPLLFHLTPCLPYLRLRFPRRRRFCLATDFALESGCVLGVLLTFPLAEAGKVFRVCLLASRHTLSELPVRFMPVCYCDYWSGGNWLMSFDFRSAFPLADYT